MTQEQACILADMIEVSTEGCWPRVREAMLDYGWTKDEIIGAADALAAIAHRSPIIESGDF